MDLKKITTLTTEEKLILEYEQLLKSGMFWEFYPELTGNYKEDRSEYVRSKVNNMKIFSKEYIDSLPTPKVNYVIGVDCLDDDANTYCLMRVSGDNKEVILCKSLKKGDDFDSEVNNLARYFNADLVMTEYGRIVNKPTEDKHFWATECYTNWGSIDEKIQNIQIINLK